MLKHSTPTSIGVVPLQAGLIPEEAEVGGSQNPGGYAGEGDLGLRSGWAFSDGCLSQACEAWSWWLEVASSLVYHSKMMPRFYGVPGFLQKLCCLWTYSRYFRLSFHSQQLSFPWICAANPIFQHPALLHNRRHTTQAGVCRAMARTMHSVYFVLFSWYNLLTLSCFPDCLLHSPSIPLKVPFCPSWFPHCEGSGFSECGNFSLLLSSCQNYWFLFWFLFSFFLSFFRPNCEAIFLVLLGIWSLLLNFGRCSVKLFHL